MCNVLSTFLSKKIYRSVEHKHYEQQFMLLESENAQASMDMESDGRCERYVK